MHNILSIAGGGFMGIGPARYLMELERDLNAPNIAHKFEGFTGTSTGAIITALLACGYSASDVHQIYLDNIADVFQSPGYRARLSPFGPKYMDEYINRMLLKYLGNITFAHASSPLWLTSYNARRRQAKIWGPDDANVPIRYAVRCSMAAPTFFAPVDGAFVDGGLVANEPVLVGASALKRALGCPMTEIRPLSLVTSGKQSSIGKKLNPNWSVIGWAPILIDCLTAGNSADIEFIAKAIWEDGYLRVCPETPKYDLDDVKLVDNVSRIWAHEYALNGATTKAWLVGQ